jgi:hypothetical protein
VHVHHATIPAAQDGELQFLRADDAEMGDPLQLADAVDAVIARRARHLARITPT